MANGAIVGPGNPMKHVIPPIPLSCNETVKAYLILHLFQDSDVMLMRHIFDQLCVANVLFKDGNPKYLESLETIRGVMSSFERNVHLGRAVQVSIQTFGIHNYCIQDSVILDQFVLFPDTKGLIHYKFLMHICFDLHAASLCFAYYIRKSMRNIGLHYVPQTIAYVLWV